LVENDLEITGVLPKCQNPVQCVLIKPKWVKVEFYKNLRDF
jgi:hypothetical protein